MIFFVEVLGLIFNKTKWRLRKYIYFGQSLTALKKRKMKEILKNKNAKSFKILLSMHPDVDDLIKDTLFFLTHPNDSVFSCLSRALSVVHRMREYKEDKKSLFLSRS